MAPFRGILDKTKAGPSKLGTASANRDPTIFMTDLLPVAADEFMYGVFRLSPFGLMRYVRHF